MVKKFSCEFWLIAIFMGLNFASYIGSEANLVPIAHDVLLSRDMKPIFEEKEDVYMG